MLLISLHVAELGIERKKKIKTLVRRLIKTTKLIRWGTEYHTSKTNHVNLLLGRVGLGVE